MAARKKTVRTVPQTLRNAPRATQPKYAGPPKALEADPEDVPATTTPAADVRVVPLAPQRSGAWAQRLAGWRIIRQTPDGEYVHVPSPDGNPNWQWDATREELCVHGGVIYAYPIRDDGRQWGPPVGPITAGTSLQRTERTALESAIGDEFAVFLAEFKRPEDRLLFAILQKYHNVTVQLLMKQNAWQASLYERHVQEIKAAHLRCDRIAGGYVEALAATHGVDAALSSSKLYKKLIDQAGQNQDSDEIEDELRELLGPPLREKVRAAVNSELRDTGLLGPGPAKAVATGTVGPGAAR